MPACRRGAKECKTLGLGVNLVVHFSSRPSLEELFRFSRQNVSFVFLLSLEEKECEILDIGISLAVQSYRRPSLEEFFTPSSKGDNDDKKD